MTSYNPMPEDSISTTDTEGEVEPLSRRTKLLTAAAIFFGNIGLALVCHVHGPALTSFQKKYQTSDATISIVFSLMTAGIATGSLLSGFLFRHVNRQLAIIYVFGCMGICMFSIPFCPNLIVFFIVSGLMGLFGGFYAAAQFTWMLEMMQSECAPYVIAEHFFYALGIIVSSLVLAPFLDKGGPNHNSENATLTVVEFTPLENESHGIMELLSSHDFQLVIPFAIFAVFLEMAMIFQLLLYKFCRYHAPPSDKLDNDAPEEDEENKTRSRKSSTSSSESSPLLENNRRTRSRTRGSPGSRHRDSITSASLPYILAEISLVMQSTKHSVVKRLLLIIYLGVFCGSFKGMEDNVVAFLPKYAQNGPFHMSESDSAYVLSASMLAYTLSRFLGIFIVYKIPPRGILCFNLGLTIVCNYMLMTYAFTSQTVLWVTAVLFGVAFSTAYGCFSAYLERFLRVTDGVGAWVLLYGAGIAAVYPIVIGHYIEKNPIVLAYTSWVSIGICSFIFFVSSVQTYFDKHKY